MPSKLPDVPSKLPDVPRLMGILNATPDSFSDGGKFNSVEAAVSRTLVLIAEGAILIDVGGESTRPGAVRLSASEEQSRVMPIIEALVVLPEISSGEVEVSIDTLNSSTAVLAVEAGAAIINDVSGGKADPRMFELVSQLSQRERSVKYVLGHWGNFAEGAGAVQQTEDIVGAVVDELAARVKLALEAGVKLEQIVLDPGLGFGKDSAQNWQLLAGLERLASLELPILIGASRKRFLASAVAALHTISAAEVTIEQRDAATAELSARLWQESQTGGFADKLWGFRVHNVGANRSALHSAAAARFAH